MKGTVCTPNECGKCVFHRNRCTLGLRRPWNAVSCKEFRPYCLVCSYPEMFCNTCGNLARRGCRDEFATSDMLIGSEKAPIYSCVWAVQ